MTKREFLERVDDGDISFWDLRDIAEQYDICDDIQTLTDHEGFIDWAYEEARFFLDECGLEDLKHFLNSLDFRYDYYITYDGHTGITDDDMSWIVDDIVRTMDECELWDEELYEQEDEESLLSECNEFKQTSIVQLLLI